MDLYGLSGGFSPSASWMQGILDFMASILAWDYFKGILILVAAVLIVRLILMRVRGILFRG